MTKTCVVFLLLCCLVLKATQATTKAATSQPTGTPGGTTQPTGAPGGNNQPTGAPGGNNQPTGAPGGYNQPTGAPGGSTQPTIAPNAGGGASQLATSFMTLLLPALLAVGFTCFR